MYPAPMNDVEYGDALRGCLLRRIDWENQRRLYPSDNHIIFRMKRDFDIASKFLAFKLISSLYLEYGNPIVPTALDDGCVRVDTYFESVVDHRGREVRDLFRRSATYHRIFSSFDVERIILHRIPPGMNGEDRSSVFVLDGNGVPLPA